MRSNSLWALDFEDPATDMAEGVMAKLPDDQSWINEINLKPRVKFNVRQHVKPSAITHFHEMAHHDCFIAQSIKTKVTIRSP